MSEENIKIYKKSKYFNNGHWESLTKNVPSCLVMKVDAFMNKLDSLYPSRKLLGFESNKAIYRSAEILKSALGYNDLKAFLLDFGFSLDGSDSFDLEFDLNEVVITKKTVDKNISLESNEKAVDNNVLLDKLETEKKDIVLSDIFKNEINNSHVYNDEFWTTTSDKNKLGVDEEVNKLFNSLYKSYNDFNVISLDGYKLDGIIKRYNYISEAALLTDYGFNYALGSESLERINDVIKLLNLKEGMSLKEYGDILFNLDIDTYNKVNEILSPKELINLFRLYLKSSKLDEVKDSLELTLFNQMFSSTKNNNIYSVFFESPKKEDNTKEPLKLRESIRNSDIGLFNTILLDFIDKEVKNGIRYYDLKDIISLANSLDIKLDSSLLATYFLKLDLCDDIKAYNDLYYYYLNKIDTSKYLLKNYIVDIKYEQISSLPNDGIEDFINKYSSNLKYDDKINLIFNTSNTRFLKLGNSFDANEKLYNNERGLNFNDVVKLDDIDSNLILPTVLNGYAVGYVSYYISKMLINVKELTLPSILKSIVNDGNFLDKAIKLRNIKIDSRNKNIKIKDGFLLEYYNSKCYLIRPTDAIKREYNVPDYVDYIFDGAFKNLKLVEKINIPDSVKGIGNEAFLACPRLKEITGCKNIEYLGGYLFCYDNALAEFNIPSSVLNASNLLFYNKPKSLKITGGSPWLIYKDNLVISKTLCVNHERYELDFIEECESSFFIVPDYIKRIGFQALNNTNIKYLYLPKEIEYIEFGETKNTSSNLERIFIDEDSFNYSLLISQSEIYRLKQSDLLYVVKKEEKLDIMNQYFKEDM